MRAKSDGPRAKSDQTPCPSRLAAPLARTTPSTRARIRLGIVLEHNLRLSLRLVAGTFACAIVGAERQLRGHEAGLRTFGLVGLGSASLVTLSLDAFPSSTDKVVAGIVTGIGFLGAGMLIRSGEQVKNLTSAAASWAAAALGSVFGGGRYFLGAVMLVLALILLEIAYVPGLSSLDSARAERLGQPGAPPPD